MPSNRRFGFSFALVFAVLAAVLAWKGATQWAGASFAAALLFAALAAASPNVLALPNRLWFRLGELLGRVVSPVVLGAMYFVLITPLAVVLRLAGRDALRLRPRPADSYWIERDPPGPSPESFRNQF